MATTLTRIKPSGVDTTAQFRFDSVATSTTVVGNVAISDSGGGSIQVATVAANGQVGTPVSVTPATIRTPTITTPSAGANNVSTTPTIEGSLYAPLYTVDARNYRQLQIDVAAGDFSTPVVDQQANTDNITVGTALTPLITYKSRMRDVSTTGAQSDWSPLVSFSIADEPDYIATPTATPGSIGASFEGGFYAGLIWNEVAQSNTSKTSATGSQTFTLTTDMSVTPLFYEGQTVQVRSRSLMTTAAFHTIMTGTVTDAKGANLTIDVTNAIGAGMGARNDWSVMARYRVIVAPRSSGQSGTTLSWQTTIGSFGPDDTWSLNEGWKATLSMTANSTLQAAHPAANFTRSLNINGYTDWYLPSRDELELCYRHLGRNSTDYNNSTYARANTADTNIYFRYGADGRQDINNSVGGNLNSDPVGSPYTNTSPSMTSIAAFQGGGAECFSLDQFSIQRIWSSTQFNANGAWMQNFSASQTGQQGTMVNKNSTGFLRTRAVRRSII